MRIRWLACALCGAALAAPADGAARTHVAVVRTQIPYNQPVAVTYPHAASVGIAIAVVPDPLVPRYRRLYDLGIKAIEMGMLRDNFVLDRYAFPWSQTLRLESSATASSSSSGAKPPAPATDAENGDSGAFGLMIFRCDAWRGDHCGFGANSGANGKGPKTGTRLRALYVVTDTAAQGVATRQLRCAIRRIQSQLTDASAAPSVDHECPASDRLAESPDRDSGGPEVSLLDFPDWTCHHGGRPTWVILGPDFSGAMESVGSAIQGLPGLEAADVCLVSSSTTDTTNSRIRDAYAHLYYRQLALPDRSKIYHVARFALQAGIDLRPGSPRAIAVLAEASTFGYGVCALSSPDKHATSQEITETQLVNRFCSFARTVYFPATIADIRYGLQQQQATQSNDLATAARQVQGDEHLSLENGAENGSEFPESEESALTSASDQLQLDQTLLELTKLAPRMIVVVATDVRDRLFLFDQLRQRLPRALLVDLEADNLLTHPDFLHASRGALAVASTDLMVHEGLTFGCEPEPRADTPRSAHTSLSPWSTDDQAILADTVSRLYEHDLPESTAPCAIPGKGISMPVARQAALEVVTLEGFRVVSSPFPGRARTAQWWRPSRPALLLYIAEVYAPGLCCVLSLIWLYPRLRERLAATSASSLRQIKIGHLALIIAVPFILLAFIACFILERNLTLTYLVCGITVVAIYGLARSDRRLQESFDARSWRLDLSWWVAFALAFVAVLMASGPLIWSLSRHPAGYIVDDDALIALAFDASTGAAFFLAPASAAIMLLSTSAGLATCAVINRRNAQALADLELSSPPSRRRLHALHTLLAVAFVLLLTLPGLINALGGARLTIFDPHASTLVLLALSATTLCATLLLLGTMATLRRIQGASAELCRRIATTRLATGAARQAQAVGLWTGGTEMRVLFPATPVVAGPSVAERGITHDPSQWRERLRSLWSTGEVSDAHRVVLFELFASQMSVFRWAAAGTTLSALASVGIVYLYPLEADTLLLWNLIVLALVGFVCAFAATDFELDEVLSNVLCNRSRKMKISSPLFFFIAVPFLVLAAAITVITLPGVVDWAGGVLAMIRSLGIHP